MNVLIVDDYPANRRLLRINLESEGHRVLEAADGCDALETLENPTVGSIDAVISDILMPRMDGYRFCYELRRREKLCGVPVLIYSGTYTSHADEALALQIGADRFFRKPDGLGSLLDAVRHIDTRTVPPRPPVRPPDHSLVLKEYSEELIFKLETVVRESEAARAALEISQRTLLYRNLKLDAEGDALRESHQRLEQRLQERTEELATTNDELESFVYAISHDLRNLLMVIRALTDVLSKEVPQATEEECLIGIDDAGKQMQQIIQGLMSLVRLDHTLLERTTVDVTFLVTGIVNRLQAMESTRSVEVRIDNGITADADSMLMLIAFENLVENAWKFTSKSAMPRIEIGAEKYGENLLVFVRDNGAGFDMKHATKMFQPFRRMHRQSEFPGTGLGLATVRRIMQKHGGKIWAESEPGRGATFFLAF